MMEDAALYLRTPDSLHTSADTLHRAGNNPLACGDSLRVMTGSPCWTSDVPLQPADTLFCGIYSASDYTQPPQSDFREVAPEEVFGQESTLYEGWERFSVHHDPLIGSPVFQSLSLCIVVLFTLMLHHQSQNARLLLRSVLSDRGASDRLVGDSLCSNTSPLLNLTTMIGMLVLAVLTVKVAGGFLDESVLRSLSHGSMLLGGAVLVLMYVCAALYQFVVLKFMGALLLASDFVAHLWVLKRVYFSFSVIIATPVMVFYLLSTPQSGGIWLSIVTIELIIALFLFFKETIGLFLSEKISILHWFLYLCGVEIFPFSLLWLLLRN